MGIKVYIPATFKHVKPCKNPDYVILKFITQEIHTDGETVIDPVVPNLNILLSSNSDFVGQFQAGKNYQLTCNSKVQQPNERYPYARTNYELISQKPV